MDVCSFRVVGYPYGDFSARCVLTYIYICLFTAQLIHGHPESGLGILWFRV